MKITKKGVNNNCKIVREIIQKKKKQSMEETDIRKCLKKINKN